MVISPGSDLVPGFASGDVRRCQCTYHQRLFPAGTVRRKTRRILFEQPKRLVAADEDSYVPVLLGNDCAVTEGIYLDGQARVTNPSFGFVTWWVLVGTSLPQRVHSSLRASASPCRAIAPRNSSLVQPLRALVRELRKPLCADEGLCVDPQQNVLPILPGPPANRTFYILKPGIQHKSNRHLPYRNHAHITIFRSMP
jgi:hypothetical protein